MPSSDSDKTPKNPPIDRRGMTGEAFLRSSWVERAKEPDAEKEAGNKLKRWKARVRNSPIRDKADGLWQFLTSNKVTGMDKTVLLGAVLYIISPLDLIPDAIPVVGWLDDLGVAAFALSYITAKLAGASLSKSGMDTPLYAAPAAMVFRESTESGTLSDGLSYRLEELRDAAREIEADSHADYAEDLAEDFGDDLFRVMFVGRYNTGKSTLINVFLRGASLPVGPVPTTRALTYIMRGTVPQLYSEQPNGEIVLHSDPSALHTADDSAIRAATAFTLFLPTASFPDGIGFVDTPGLADTRPEISAKTLDALPFADALVVLLDAAAPFSGEEKEFVAQLPESCRTRKTFFVLNRMDKVAPEERGEVKRGVMRALEDAGAESPRLFCLSAVAAMRAREAGETDPDFNAFRMALNEFLREGAPAQQRAERERRLAALRQDLIAACDDMEANAARDASARRNLTARAVDDRKKAEAKIREAERKLDAEMEIILQRFRANASACFRELDLDLKKRVNEARDAASLAHEKLDRFAINRLQAFLSREVGQIEAAWSVRAASVRADLANALQAAEAPLRVSTSPSFLEKHPDALILGGLALAWPLTGMFTFMALAVGGLLGQNMVAGLVQGAMGHVALGSARAELNSKIADALPQLREQVERNFEQALKTMRERHIRQLRMDGISRLETVGERVEGESAEAAEKKARVARRIKERISPSL